MNKAPGPGRTLKLVCPACGTAPTRLRQPRRSPVLGAVHETTPRWRGHVEHKGDRGRAGYGAYSRRRLTVKGRGSQARDTFSLEAYHDKVWITSFDCPFVREAILEIAQADALAPLIAQTAQEARGYKNGPTS